MQFSRRGFIGAATATVVGMSTVSCGPSRISTPPVASAPPPPLVPAQPVEPPTLLGQAKAALDQHASVILQRDRIGLVDFSLPSSQPRFHVVDLAGGRIESSHLVAHGVGSDPTHTGMLHYFSNLPGSHATSRGTYLTADPYYGKYGLSQRLIGLDPDNSMALDRAIVVHGAPYVDPRLIATRGRIGRSYGCFALELAEVNRVMQILGQGRMIYAGKVA
jgi:hypothetical protein